MDITVIVPSYNKKQFLPGLIKSLLDQDYRGSYEIKIIDDGSTDGSEDVVKPFLSKKLSYIRQRNSGPASARNLGLKSSSGKIVVFTDADCIPAKNWLSEIGKAFAQSVSSVEGRTETQGKIYPDSHFIKNHAGGMFLTCNIAFLKKSIKGFDERYKYPNREDSDIAFGLLKSRKEIVFTKKAVVSHRLLKSSIKSMIRRKFYFKSDILLFKKYPKLYKEKIRYPFEMFTLLYLIAAVAGFVNNWIWLALPLIAMTEIIYRKYAFSMISFVKFLVAQTLGSFVNVYAIIAGCVEYKVNPFRLLL